MTNIDPSAFFQLSDPAAENLANSGGAVYQSGQEAIDWLNQNGGSAAGINPSGYYQLSDPAALAGARSGMTLYQSGQEAINWNNANGIPTIATAATPGPSGDTNIGGAPSNGMATDQVSAWAQLQNTLQQYGFSGTDLTSLVSWAKNEIISGNSSDQITLDLQQTQQFKNRFPGIALRAQQGLPPITPAEYVQLENSYTQILRQAGLPAGFYDNPQDFAQLIGADVAPTELQDRVANAYDVVSTAPQEVQQAFQSFYGPSGQAALAAYVIDPTRAEPALLKQVQSAQVAGSGSLYGFGLDRGTAEKMAALGIDQNQATTGFKEASQFQSLIHGGINETNPLGQQGVVAGEFGLEPGANLALAQALRERQAAFNGGGQASETATGISGLGTARSI